MLKIADYIDTQNIVELAKKAAMNTDKRLRRAYQSASPGIRENIEEKHFGGELPEVLEEAKAENTAERERREKGRAVGQPPPNTYQTSYSSPAGAQWERGSTDDEWRATSGPAGRQTIRDEEGNIRTDKGVPVNVDAREWKDPETGTTYVRGRGPRQWREKTEADRGERREPAISGSHSTGLMDVISNEDFERVGTTTARAANENENKSFSVRGPDNEVYEFGNTQELVDWQNQEGGVWQQAGNARQPVSQTKKPEGETMFGPGGVPTNQQPKQPQQNRQTTPARTAVNRAVDTGMNTAGTVAGNAALPGLGSLASNTGLFDNAADTVTDWGGNLWNNNSGMFSNMWNNNQPGNSLVSDNPATDNFDYSTPGIL